MKNYKKNKCGIITNVGEDFAKWRTMDTYRQFFHKTSLGLVIFLKLSRYFLSENGLST